MLQPQLATATGSEPPEQSDATVVHRLRGRRGAADAAAPAQARGAKREREPKPRWPALLALALIAALALGAAGLLARKTPEHATTAHGAAARVEASSARAAASAPAAAAAPHKKLLADNVRGDLQMLVDAPTREERVSSAQALLRHVPIEEVPTY